MNKFCLLFALAFLAWPFCVKANVISYDSATQTYVVDQYGASIINTDFSNFVTQIIQDDREAWIKKKPPPRSPMPDCPMPSKIKKNKKHKTPKPCKECPKMIPEDE